MLNNTVGMAQNWFLGMKTLLGGIIQQNAPDFARNGTAGSREQKNQSRAS